MHNNERGSIVIQLSLVHKECTNMSLDPGAFAKQLEIYKKYEANFEIALTIGGHELLRILTNKSIRCPYDKIPISFKSSIVNISNLEYGQ